LTIQFFRARPVIIYKKYPSKKNNAINHSGHTDYYAIKQFEDRFSMNTITNTNNEWFSVSSVEISENKD
jgi:hypothetical protein